MHQPIDTGEDKDDESSHAVYQGIPEQVRLDIEQLGSAISHLSRKRSTVSNFAQPRSAGLGTVFPLKQSDDPTVDAFTSSLTTPLPAPSSTSESDQAQRRVFYLQQTLPDLHKPRPASTVALEVHGENDEPLFDVVFDHSSDSTIVFRVIDDSGIARCRVARTKSEDTSYSLISEAENSDACTLTPVQWTQTDERLVRGCLHTDSQTTLYEVKGDSVGRRYAMLRHDVLVAQAERTVQMVGGTSDHDLHRESLRDVDKTVSSWMVTVERVADASLIIGMTLILELLSVE